MLGSNIWFVEHLCLVDSLCQRIQLPDLLGVRRRSVVLHTGRGRCGGAPNLAEQWLCEAVETALKTPPRSYGVSAAVELP